MYMICKYTSYNKYNKKCMTMSIEQGNKFSVKVVFSLNLFFSQSFPVFLIL